MVLCRVMSCRLDSLPMTQDLTAKFLECACGIPGRRRIVPYELGVPPEKKWEISLFVGMPEVEDYVRILFEEPKAR